MRLQVQNLNGYLGYFYTMTTMKTNTDKPYSHVRFSRIWVGVCCLIFAIIGGAEQSSAYVDDVDELDLSVPLLYRLPKAPTVAKPVALHADEPVVPQVVVLEKSQEDWNSNWNQSGYWESDKIPNNVQNTIFIVGDGYNNKHEHISFRVRSDKSSQAQTQSFGVLGSNNSLYIGYKDGSCVGHETDSDYFSELKGILHLKGPSGNSDNPKPDYIKIENLVIGNGEIFQGAANAIVTLDGKLTVNGDAFIHIIADANTDTETRSLVILSEVHGNGNITIKDDDPTNKDKVSLMNISRGDNPFTGTITIAEDTHVILSGKNAFGSASSFINNGLLEIQADQSLSNITGSGKIVFADNCVLTLNCDQLSYMSVPENTTFGGENVTLLKTGDGTLQIVTEAGAAVRAESFVVSSGRLDMEGYFQGNLKVGGDTLPDGEIFSPGAPDPDDIATIGTANIEGELILYDSAILLMEIGGTEMDKNDQLIIDAQNITFNPGSVVKFELADNTTYQPKHDDVIKVKMPYLWNKDNVAFSSQAFILSYYDSETGIQYLGVNPNYVPEPSTWALLILGAAGMYFFARKKRLK